VCFLLGLVCLHNYVNAGSIYKEAIEINSNQNASQPAAFNEASKLLLIKAAQIKQNVSLTDGSNNPLSVGAIIGIVIGTMVGFCIFCCFCFYCLKGFLSDFISE